MDNQEEILDALNDFEKKKGEIPPVLEQYLKTIAKTGETLFPWPRVKPLFVGKLENVMSKFNRELPADHLAPCPNVENPKFKEMRKRILDSLNKFSDAPFTIQRLCELLTDPKKHYRRTDKFMRGVEKNMLVVSTVDPFGNKIVSESREAMVNGMEGSPVNGNEADSPTTTPNIGPTLYPGAIPLQQTNWTTDSWAGVGTSQEEARDTTCNEDPPPGAGALASDPTPHESVKEEEKEAPPDTNLETNDRDQAPQEESPPLKKSKLSDEISEEIPESASSKDDTRQTDTPLISEDKELPTEHGITQSPQVVTSESSEVKLEQEVSLEAESSEKPETMTRLEQNDLNENSPESSHVPSQDLEGEKCDNDLPQESITSTQSESNSHQDQRSQNSEECCENLPHSSEEETKEKEKNQKENSTQSEQSNEEPTKESDAISAGEEEQMNVDYGTKDVKANENADLSAEKQETGGQETSGDNAQIGADSTKTSADSTELSTDSTDMVTDSTAPGNDSTEMVTDDAENSADSTQVSTSNAEPNDPPSEGKETPMEED